MPTATPDAIDARPAAPAAGVAPARAAPDSSRDTLPPWVPTLAAVLVAAGVAAWVMTDRLGADRLWGDEATYALVVDRMIATGDWLHPSTDGTNPYFDKPPLYMWLTALTVPLFDDPLDVTRYRAWAAGLGVASVAATVVLAAIWFDAVVAVVAGLFLALADRFLFLHGARHGGLDTGLVLSIVLAAIAYSAWFKGRLDGRIAWPLVGVACGLASWFKPLAGVPLVPLLLAHALLFDRRRATWQAKALGAVVALAVCVALVAPWYAYALHEYGTAFRDKFFGRNLAERITTGVSPRHLQDWSYYWTEIADASAPFWCYWIALPALAALAWRGRMDRASVGLLWVVGIGWVVLFSLSPSKFLHYVYPAFPFIAAGLAAAAACAVRAVAATPGGRQVRFGAVAGLATAAAFGVVATRVVYGVTPDRQDEYRPWTVYRALQPAVASGQLRLIAYGWPQWFDSNNTNWYAGRMPEPRRLTSLAEVSAAIASGDSFLLMWHKPSGELPADVRAALLAASDPRYAGDADDLSAFVVNAAPVLSPTAAAGEATKAIRWPGGDALPAQLELTPPVAGAATLLLDVAWDAADRPARVSWLVTQPTRSRPGHAMPAAADRQTVAVPLLFRPSAVGKPQVVSVAFFVDGTDGHGRPVKGRVLGATVRYAPTAPDRPRGATG